jgi:stage V sporulation protein G
VDISEIRVKLVDGAQERLKAFCTVTMHREFVIRDVKVIEGPRGPFVAMPSRKVMDRCAHCGGKNHLRANHCNDCGRPLPADRAPRDDRGRARLHIDVAHPINQECRSSIETQILAAYRAELDRSRDPNYVAPEVPDDDDYIFDHDPFLAPQHGLMPAPGVGSTNGERTGHDRASHERHSPGHDGINHQA